MAILLSAKNLTHAFGARPLFEDLSFVIEEGERIGLIGPNGVGKSSLLRILGGIAQVDSGELSLRAGLKIGFLQQSPEIPQGQTVEEAVLGKGPQEADLSVVGEILSKLELNSLTQHPAEKLSGGWKKRVALARELVKEPDLLLLDEPTNHLDIESILWLESFLQKASFATLTVTHDRYFLRNVTNRILELDRRNPKGLLSVEGNYSNYLERKEELLALQEREETVLRNTLRRETEWLRRGPKARTTKQKARIHAAENLKDEVEELQFRNQVRTAGIEFHGTGKKPKRLIEAKKISKSFADKVLFNDFDVFVGPKDRIGLLGVNGCGKSTLIKILLDQEKPDSGSVLRAEQLRVAYFDQARDTLDSRLTLRKALCPSGDQVLYRGRPVHIHGYLDRFLFRKEQIDMQVGKLSGGERARVLIANLMLKEADLLVLDEPTNDLDVETLNVLQDCLTDFDGAVLLVTHDRYFLDQVATEIFAFGKTGQIIRYAGLDQWESAQEEKPTVVKAQPAKVEPMPEKKRKLGFNETRELAGMEGRIQAAEEKLAQLEKESQLPENLSNSKKLSEIFQAIALAQSEVEQLYARWAELEALK